MDASGCSEVLARGGLQVAGLRELREHLGPHALQQRVHGGGAARLGEGGLGRQQLAQLGEGAPQLQPAQLVVHGHAARHLLEGGGARRHGRRRGGSLLLLPLLRRPLRLRRTLRTRRVAHRLYARPGVQHLLGGQGRGSALGSG